MRRALLALVAFVVATTAGSGCGGDDDGLTPAERGAAAEANQRILDALPPLGGTTFHSFTEVDPPRGGRGLMWYVRYSIADGVAPVAALDELAAALPEWHVVDADTDGEPASATFVNGEAWLSAVAGPHGERREPAITVVVNALDARVLTR